MYWKAICFFFSKSALWEHYLYCSALQVFWDQRTFLLFQDIREARHDIYHKVQMTKTEQNALCFQHLCMNVKIGRTILFFKIFFLLRVDWGLQENWVKSEIAFVVAQICHYYCMLFFSWKTPKLCILRENQFEHFCYNTKKPENTYCWI